MILDTDSKRLLRYALDELKPADLFRIVMPDLRGPLGRHPESEANSGGIWIPAYAGMTAFFHDL
jgi:hypothetical protein